MNKIIVGMGEALWDCLPEGKKIGGAPANFAYHASQFGFDSRVVSAVGADADGDEILDVFARKGLRTQIERVPYPTGTVQVTLDAVGVPCYEIKEGVAWDNIPFTDELKRLALNTRAVCFGSLAQRSETSRITINRFLDTMPDAEGQLKIFDINLRQGFYTKEILCESMRRCNILKINDEELVTISRIFGYPGIDLQDKCWILLAKYNLKMLILTCGTNGRCSLREWFPSRRRPRYRWRTPLEPVTRSRQPSPLPFSAGSRCPMPINWRWKSLPMYVPRAVPCRNCRTP